MNILADENIPGLEALFSPLGHLRTLPGSTIRAADIDGVDVLLVRSVTRVDRELLQGGAVSFVGSCTTGIDHVDLGYLRGANIGFGHAPGANARSVVEYVLSVLCWLSQREDIRHKTVGVLGLGHVGNRLCLLLSRLGMRCMAYDPWVRGTEAEAVEQVEQLETLLGADILTLHVPLSHNGPHPTRHLIDAARLERLRDGALLINSSRGGVVDNRALAAALNARPSLRAVLDVWEGEPAIDTGVLRQVALATPHIAGYSYDGKYRGSEMVCEALRTHLGLSSGGESQLGQSEIVLSGHVGSGLDWPELCHLMGEIYNVTADDRRMRDALQGDARVASVFEGLRRSYPMRRESSAYRLGDGARNPLDLLFDWVERTHRRR